MHPKYASLCANLELKLASFAANVQPLPGITSAGARLTLAKQFVESERKQDRVRRLAQRIPAPDRLKPGLESFDPELAAVERRMAGDIDEACWLVFLSVHFGRHKDDGWQLCRQIYGAMGPSPYWTWNRVSQQLPTFRGWLDNLLQGQNQPLGRFGNHRKYESLSSPTLGLASVFESYVRWVSAAGSHTQLIGSALQNAGHDPGKAFALLFQQMKSVLRFGRLARFDFLTTLEKLGIAAIEADSTYLADATGPKRGARLLFGGSGSATFSNAELEAKVGKLASHLGLGMQTMEDALCNWQKSPSQFAKFRG